MEQQTVSCAERADSSYDSSSPCRLIELCGEQQTLGAEPFIIVIIIKDPQALIEPEEPQRRDTLDYRLL